MADPILTDNELLDIELRNKGNADIEKLVEYVKWLDADADRCALCGRIDEGCRCS